MKWIGAPTRHKLRSTSLRFIQTRHRNNWVNRNRTRIWHGMIHVLFQTVMNHRRGGGAVRLQWGHVPHARSIYLTRTRNQRMVPDRNLRWPHSMIRLLNVVLRGLHRTRHGSRSNRTGNIVNRNRVYWMRRISSFWRVVNNRVIWIHVRVLVQVQVRVRFRFRFGLIFLGVSIRNRI